MSEYLCSLNVQCDDCFKCLHECMVKAIAVKDREARILEDRCILCGHCTMVCPQNAKVVVSETEKVLQLIASGKRVIASVAPSFVSSFGISNFTTFKLALARLGFTDAEETAVGAEAVTRKYKELLEGGTYENFITSACPAACQLIQKYYPNALQYLAKVDSPMIAHAKMLREQYPGAKIVFIGPCIAKKKEAEESGLLAGVLTFTELRDLFEAKGIVLSDIMDVQLEDGDRHANYAKNYPVSRGIINSFQKRPEGYSYLAIDGIDRCVKALENIEHLNHVFLEMNVCNDGCIGGPCSLKKAGGTIQAACEIWRYVDHEKKTYPVTPDAGKTHVILEADYPRLRTKGRPVSNQEIENVLHRIGKYRPEDERNCGSCGYHTCREKAWAVINGYADIDVCLPYMRQRAETMSYEIIRNSPEGIVVLTNDLKILEINNKALELLGIGNVDFKGRLAADFFNPEDFLHALGEDGNIFESEMFLEKTDRYVKLTVTKIPEQHVLFGILKDVTSIVNYNQQLDEVRQNTIRTADEVITKQMRVAQEIASLLGETTAETKVALVNLKKILEEDKKEE
jgi:iron only hydrogenase large subunit-like protein/uncharacterized Fe-S cluster-containing protein